MTTGNVEFINFNAYIYRVLKQVHPDAGISGSASASMDAIVRVLITKITRNINQFFMQSNKKTISSREVQSATRLTLPGELQKRAVSEGTKAVTKYNLSRTDAPKKQTKAKSEPRSHRAGLTFNISRVERVMMIETNAARKSATAAVYLAAVCEYVTAEILELAGNCARDHERVRITPRCIKLAIANDVELNTLFKDTIIPGGVVPTIHQHFLPEQTSRKKDKGITPKTITKKSTKKSTKK